MGTQRASEGGRGKDISMCVHSWLCNMKNKSKHLSVESGDDWLAAVSRGAGKWSMHLPPDSV